MISLDGRHLNSAKAIRILLNSWEVEEAAELLGLDNEDLREMARAEDFNEKMYENSLPVAPDALESVQAMVRALTNRAVEFCLLARHLDSRHPVAGSIALRTIIDPGKVPSREAINHALDEALQVQQPTLL